MRTQSLAVTHDYAAVVVVMRDVVVCDVISATRRRGSSAALNERALCAELSAAAAAVMTSQALQVHVAQRHERYEHRRAHGFSARHFPCTATRLPTQQTDMTSYTHRRSETRQASPQRPTLRENNTRRDMTPTDTSDAPFRQCCRRRDTRVAVHHPRRPHA